MFIVIILGVFAFLIVMFLKQNQFGSLPNTDIVNNKPVNHNGNQFVNESFTPDLTEGKTYGAVIREMLFNKNKRKRPLQAVPTLKSDLFQLAPDKDVLIWFGHASYLMKLDEKYFLIDPVFSGSASPLPFSVKSFRGTDIYSVDDLPTIDYLLISHDHWDHLDYKTIAALRPKIRKVICGLGTGAHFLRWGYLPSVILEKNWNETIALAPGFTLSTIAARHFSGRGLKRNQSLWLSFVLQTPTKKIFIGGDSGFDTHFKRAGEQFGPFDLAILECGQYDESWKYIHMMPKEVMLAAAQLKAKTLLPVHWGKFKLANHNWDDPIEQLTQLNMPQQISICTPLIGETVYLDEPVKSTTWWRNVS